MAERCPSCGKLMVSGKCLDCGQQTALQILRRDMFLLGVLAIIAVLMFFVTRRVAALNRRMNLRLAAHQYQLGESHLRSGEVSDAIDSFRGAIARDNQNQLYTLALANALVLAEKYQEAQHVLLNLREVVPNDPNISLELARVAAKSGSVSEATRYYQNALYGINGAKQSDLQRNRARLEFVHFLVDQKQHALALSELLVFASNLPTHDPAHIRAGQLFLELDDPQRALLQFREMRPSDPEYGEALAGMASAEFQLSNYESARHYAAEALKDNPKLTSAASTLNIANLVLQNDPLAPRLTYKERTQRLINSLDSAIEEVASCLNKLASAAPSDSTNSLESLRKQAMNIRAGLMARDQPADIDLLRNGIGVVYESEAAAEKYCGNETPLSQALLLIGRKHGAIAQ